MVHRDVLMTIKVLWARVDNQWNIDHVLEHVEETDVQTRTHTRTHHHTHDVTRTRTSHT